MNEPRAAIRISFYNYDPSLSAAFIFAILYTTAFAGTLLQFIRYRSWVWTIMVVSSGMEAGGYITRYYSVQDPTGQLMYTISLVLIFLAPVCMAAACYIVFGRIIYHVVPRESRTVKVLWLPVQYITPIFVTGDLIALVFQTFGAIILSGVDLSAPLSESLDRVNRGRSIAEIGVAVQLLFFGLFSIIAIRFNFVSRRFAVDFEQRIKKNTGPDKGIHEKFVRLEGEQRKVKRNWQAILLVTNSASLCILIRSVYRMLDFHMGREGYLDSHEWSFYVFDSLVILPAVVLFVWWHPSKYLPHMGFHLPKHVR